MSLVTPLAWSIASVLAAIAAIHIYWACGGRRGAEDAVPTLDGRRLFQPGAGATLLVAALLILAAALVIERARPGPGITPRIVSLSGTWIVAAVLTARAVGDFNYVGFFKRHRGTRFARLDTLLYSPLALGLGLGTAIIAGAGR